jgi:cell division protein FtsL
MAEKQKFTSIPVFGSLAYDFQTAVPLPDEEWGLPVPRREERRVVIPAPPKIEEREVTRTESHTYPRQAVSPFAILGFACAAVLIVFTLMAKIQLTVVTDQAVALEEQLSELELARNRLLIKYESVFNRTEIEEYAIGVLGMQRPTEEQITYLNSSAPDKATILGEESAPPSILDKLSDMFGFIGEYLEPPPQ